MKKTGYLLLVISVLFLSSVLPAQARGHGSFRGSVWIGPGWDPWWWGPPAYPYYYWEQPVYREEQPPVYVEPQQSQEQYYWYFCPDSKNYYPYVKQCPKGWLKVVPPTAPPDYKE